MELWRGYTKEVLCRLETCELESLLAEHGFSDGESLDVGFIRCVTEILNEKKPRQVWQTTIHGTTFLIRVCVPLRYFRKSAKILVWRSRQYELYQEKQ